MKNLNLTAIIIVVLVVAGLLAGIGIFASKLPTSTEKTVSATGNFDMQVDPDEAIVYLNIQTRELTAEAAKNQNAEITGKVLAALDKIGISKTDMQTENYNIYPEYDWSNGTQKLIGYTAQNSVKVTTKNFDTIGKIVDGAVDAGALISYINFDLSSQKNNDYKVAVLANASSDARRKAEAIASGLGKGLGELVSVQSSDYNYQPYPLYRAETVSAGVAPKAVATDITPKKLDVSATVTVTFKLR